MLKLSPAHFVLNICHQHRCNRKFHFSLATMFGNFIVLNAFVRNEKLRTINNLYIMNLSAADFCIGLGIFFYENLSYWMTHTFLLIKKQRQSPWIFLQYTYFMVNGNLEITYVMKWIKIVTSSLPLWKLSWEVKRGQIRPIRAIRIIGPKLWILKIYLTFSIV